MIVGLTWSEWLTSSGFGGLAAVVAASIAFLASRRGATEHAEVARQDRWWDRMKWAVELALSSDPSHIDTGLRAIRAISDASVSEPGEAAFVAEIAGAFIVAAPSGTIYDNQGGA